MALCRRMSKSKSSTFIVDQQTFPQTIDVLKTRAGHAGIELLVIDPEQAAEHDYFGILLQYPSANGQIQQHQTSIEDAHSKQALVTMAADILALVLLTSPGELGADIAIGSTQRFGVPLGGGGPHAAYMATRDKYKRSLPGRMVGVSVDATGNQAYRLALQTREQHIRREKATSSFYALYHGPSGLKLIASKVHHHAVTFAQALTQHGFRIQQTCFFDTFTIETGAETAHILEAAASRKINLRLVDASHIGISFNETTTNNDLQDLLAAFSIETELEKIDINQSDYLLGDAFLRADQYLQHPVFNRYHSETEMLRYIRRLGDKDLALDRAMIPLGSCTMKLNASSEMLPVSWPAFSSIHPFAPKDQTTGYAQLVEELAAMLCAVTGYAAISLQPNAGSQGEYAGLLAIKSYQEDRGEQQRDVCLIPYSAHGTNPASAQMCGMRVVVVNCDESGNVDLHDLEAKCQEYSNTLAAIMITYPSTHGVFEEHVSKVCETVHQHGGQVYIDGANLNAMVGLCYPGKFGGDVSHLNLHKTFCIPHGGGGPGVGPVAVGAHLADYLPGHAQSNKHHKVGPVASALWGSASILPISWMYMKMMGREGLKLASEVAILHANYIAAKLAPHFPILYSGASGFVAHECIIDLRDIKTRTGIDVEDVAKRLIDFGFHAPTMSFPVPGTLMIEPTESESLQEIDRFCDAMISIANEISAIESGKSDAENNPLKNAPHTIENLTAAEWPHGYSRSAAVFPDASLRESKYWPPIARVDNAYGDRNLVCSCPAITDYV